MTKIAECQPCLAQTWYKQQNANHPYWNTTKSAKCQPLVIQKWRKQQNTNHPLIKHDQNNHALLKHDKNNTQLILTQSKHSQCKDGQIKTRAIIVRNTLCFWKGEWVIWLMIASLASRHVEKQAPTCWHRKIGIPRQVCRPANSQSSCYTAHFQTRACIITWLRMGFLPVELFDQHPKHLAG